MDQQSTEEILRQELTHLRQKLQDQPTVTAVEEYEKQIADLKEKGKELEAMLKGKLMDVSPGTVLMIPALNATNGKDLAEAYRWRQLAEQFQISIFPAPTIEGVDAITDESLAMVGLKKIKPLDPYQHLDELMHHLNAELKTSLRGEAYSNIIKGCMTAVYEAMETVKVLKESDGPET